VSAPLATVDGLLWTDLDGAQLSVVLRLVRWPAARAAPAAPAAPVEERRLRLVRWPAGRAAPAAPAARSLRNAGGGVRW